MADGVGPLSIYHIRYPYIEAKPHSIVRYTTNPMTEILKNMTLSFNDLPVDPFPIDPIHTTVEWDETVQR